MKINFVQLLQIEIINDIYWKNKFIVFYSNLFIFFFLMNHHQINPLLTKQLSTILPKNQLLAFINRYHSQQSLVASSDNCFHLSSYSNTPKSKPKKLVSNSKSRVLLKKQSTIKTFKSTDSSDKFQITVRNRQQSQDNNKKIIKDKAVFINVNELPYLHSTDLLNHLYKNGSNFNSDQKQEAIPLYNPPLNNTYAFTKVKYLHIYYCKLQSLRDMGTGWGNLIQLTIYFGKLKDLSGLNAFPSLQYLNCPFNSISTLSDLMFHPTLVSLDLEFNQISDYSQVQHLFTIQNLEYVNLLNNQVYQNKETRRKINQKFEKIIETQNTRVEDYENEEKRKAWQIQHMEGIQYCNNLLYEFYENTKKDQITLKTKYALQYQNIENLNHHFEIPQIEKEIGAEEKTQKELKIEYIVPQNPSNEIFEQMIVNGQFFAEDDANFSEQKIFLTPLTQMININESYIGSVLTKYLTSKLFIKEQKQKDKIDKSNGPQSNSNSKLKFSSRTSSQNRNQNILNIGINQSAGSNNLQNSSQIQTTSELGKTSTSLSTNCTNLNNTSTSFAFKRSRLSLTRSKDKSLPKTSLLTKLSENMAQTQFVKANTLNSTQSNNFSLMKQSRMLLNKNVTGQSRKQDQQIQKINIKIKQSCLEKESFSRTLKRRGKVSENKRERNLVVQKEIQI